MNVPNYIEQRIRRPASPNSCIVLGSTSVVSFGDATRAKVATLGLNPSRAEFLENGAELLESYRRLSTHRSLGTTDLASASMDTIMEVFGDCNSYFTRNPYRRWFDPLERILEGLGVSYYNGTACHLDLVQWATDPTWRNLKPRAIRDKLIAADSEFLVEQLRRENIQLVLVNGSGVINELKRLGDAMLEKIEPIVWFGNKGKRNVTHIYDGTIASGVRAIAWSTNLQSSWGVTTEFGEALAQRVSDLGSI